MSTPTPDPYAGGFKGSTSGTTNPIISDRAQSLYNSTDAIRKALAISLKNAGYDVPTTGKPDAIASNSVRLGCPASNMDA